MILEQSSTCISIVVPGGPDSGITLNAKASCEAEIPISNTKNNEQIRIILMLFYL